MADEDSRRLLRAYGFLSVMVVMAQKKKEKERMGRRGKRLTATMTAGKEDPNSLTDEVEWCMGCSS